jgi:uncharacterized protein YjiS (DUF1127 family)
MPTVPNVAISTNLHAAAPPLAALLRQAGDTLRTWQSRSAQRRELAQWGERELHDLGVGWETVAEEVRKPFWRA